MHVVKTAIVVCTCFLERFLKFSFKILIPVLPIVYTAIFVYALYAGP